MDLNHDSSLMAYLRSVEDPRGRRGQSFEWRFLLAVLAGAIASGATSVRSIADWAKAREAELVRRLQPRSGRAPSLSTVQRALRDVGREPLEAAIAAHGRHHAAQLRTKPGQLRGLALDGKVQRGVGAHGGSLCLVSLVSHTKGLVLGQAAVPDKTNEIPAATRLLAGFDLRGWVLTADALHCHRELAQQVRDQGGHYLLAVKANQEAVHAAVVELFATPATRRFKPVESRTRSCEVGHGRHEERWLASSSLLNDYLQDELGWPGAGQVIQRRCRRSLLASGKVEEETTYFITSLPLASARAKQLEKIVRGHWTIENLSHWTRDYNWREDSCGARTGSAGEALAALHNGVLNVLRAAGHTQIARALRFRAAYTSRALACVGALRT